MDISFIVLFAVPGCFSCNARTVTKNRAKVVEEYVVSAKFDENADFPQLNDRSQPREIYQEEDTRTRQDSGGVWPLASPSHYRVQGFRDAGEASGGVDHRTTLEERDYLVHHHHLPPPLPPPPPPPPPAGLQPAPPLFAIGLIAFLILLNSLQTSLLIMKSKGSVLGPVSGVLGRRKRFASGDVEEFLERFGNTSLNLTRPEDTSKGSFLYS